MTVKIPIDRIAEICQRNHIIELSLIGSAARNEMLDDSDIDVLVLFDPNAGETLITYATVQEELADVFGRPVDLVPKDGLKPRALDEVIAESRVLYRAA